MRLTLNILTGPAAPGAVAVPPGPAFVVGRSKDCDLMIPEDLVLSRRHLEISCLGGTWLARDLGSSHGTYLDDRRLETADEQESLDADLGTYVDGVPLKGVAHLRHGQLLRAGATFLRVHFHPDGETASSNGASPDLITWPRLGTHFGTPHPTEVNRQEALPPRGGGLGGGQDREARSPDLPEPHRSVLAHLRSLPEPLYAVLDAARDPQIFAILQEYGEPFQSLYKGPPAQRYMMVAPYLVALPPGSRLLGTLVREGWGQSWGIYLSCDRPFDEIRRHLRRLLTVEIEEGPRVLFRFYDPRVLRDYLPTCTAADRRFFSGPVAALAFELESSQVGEVYRGDVGGPAMGDQVRGVEGGSLLTGRRA